MNNARSRVYFFRKNLEYSRINAICPKHYIKQQELLPLRNANVEMASSDSSENGRDLNNLIYRFDTDNPWKYFASGAPLASSVERGRKKRNPKLKKMYVGKRRKVPTSQRYSKNAFNLFVRWRLFDVAWSF